MIRICYVVGISLPFVIYYLIRISYVEQHGDKYTETVRYQIARNAISILKFNGMIRTDVYGLENLPKDGGYVMYPNHQAKYDVLGIIFAHEKPCTMMIDDKRADLPLTKEFVSLLKGSRLDKTDMRKQVNTVLQVASEVASGRRYIVFPEGGYDHNRNEVHDFLPGAFKCAMKARRPIVPVVLIDSYKVFGVNSLKPVRTQVHFLKPMYYEDYKDMTSKEISDLTRSQIISVIQKAS